MVKRLGGERTRGTQRVEPGRRGLDFEGKQFEFCSEHDEKPLEGFEQSNTI